MARKINPLEKAFKTCKRAFVLVAVFSALINLLMLTIPIYMLQVFDRVLSGQSTDTLIYLTIIAIFALLTMQLLDVVRGRVLSRLSHWMERKLSLPALSKSSDAILSGSHYGNQCLKDINQLRQFISSTSIYSLFDAPWAPIFIIFVFLLAVILGVITVIGAVILTAIALFYIWYSEKSLKEANQTSIVNQQYIDVSLENAEVIEAMGMLPGVINKWYKRNDKVLKIQGEVGDRTALLFALSKFIRLVLQVAMLGTGAYLVLKGELTGGAMIASSIILARALAPIEQAIGSWKQAQACRQAYHRLKNYFKIPEFRQSTVELPTVKGELIIESLVFVSPTTKDVILQGIGLKNKPGEITAIIGHSGAGKSTLGRLILGIWPASRGHVRLDGADIYPWNRVHFGKYSGFLPQRASLFPGTVKENICRLGQPNDEKMIAAAQFVGAHEMILHLPKGYDTPTTDYSLSGGQMQRIALARAFYNKPKLIVLDEPETHLDQEGKARLINMLKESKQQEVSIILISQNRSVVSVADHLMVLKEGKIESYGPNTIKPEE